MLTIYSQLFEPWIIIVVCAALVIFLVLTFLIFKMIAKRNLKKKMETLLTSIDSDKKNTLDNQLKRLANIANNNEAYLEIQQQKSDEYNELFNARRDNLIAIQQGLKERVYKEKITGKLMEQIKKLQESIRIYQLDISALQNELDEIFKAGDNLRVRATGLKEKFREINLDLDKYFTSLTVCYDNLKNYTEEIEMIFDLFESSMSGGKYAEASKKLDDIEKRIVPLDGKIAMIAQYNDTVENILPEKLNELLEKNNQFETEGYVISHARVKEFITNTNLLLEQSKENFKKLSFADFDEIVSEIYDKIAQVNVKLDQEVEAKKMLEETYEPISEKIKTVEAKFIKTKRHFTNMCGYYFLPEEIAHRFKLFEASATSLSDLKREYEGYIFVNTKNPASFMLEKLNIMNEKADDILSEIDYFTSYFVSVKQNIENTYAGIDQLSSELILDLGTIRLHKCHKIYEKYRSVIDSHLRDLKNLNDLLLEKPINISYIEKVYGPLYNKVQETKNKMFNEMNAYLLVAKSMVFANPLRCQFKEADRMLCEAEQDFKQENYKGAQDKINYVLNNYHPAGYDNFSGNQV